MTTRIAMQRFSEDTGSIECYVLDMNFMKRKYSSFDLICKGLPRFGEIKLYLSITVCIQLPLNMALNVYAVYKYCVNHSVDHVGNTEVP